MLHLDALKHLNVKNMRNNKHSTIFCFITDIDNKKKNKNLSRPMLFLDDHHQDKGK